MILKLNLGEIARQNLINNYGWTITDNGLDPNCTPPCLIDDSNIHAANATQ